MKLREGFAQDDKGFGWDGKQATTEADPYGMTTKKTDKGVNR